MAKSETKATLRDWRDGLQDGTVPQGVFNDREIYELELEHIFEKSWQLVGFEAEIPEPGDYVLRDLGTDEYIVTRDESGAVNVLLNRCTHQGTPVCNVSKGNSSHFRCRYHGWTFKNSGDLVGVPLKNEAYDDQPLDGEDNGLFEIPHDTYNGMIFACPDPGTDETLEEFLGEFTWYLDFFTGTSAEGYEVRGPQKHVTKVNWKIAVMNGMSDTYHIYTTHRSAMEVGVFGVDSKRSKEDAEDLSYMIHVGPGCIKARPTSFFDVYPDAFRENLREQLSDDQWRLLTEDNVMIANGGFFPNVTHVNLLFEADEGEMVPCRQFHMWQPTGPDEVVQYYWNLIEKDAPERMKELSLNAQTFMLGTGGIQMQDDNDIQSRISLASGGNNAAKQPFRVDMKLNDREVEGFTGPGTVYNAKLSEENARYFLGLCLDAITGEGSA